MFGIGGKLALGMGIALLVLGGMFYAYWNWSQGEMATLHENNAKLEVSVSMQKETIKKMDEQREEDQAKLENLAVQNEKSEEEIRGLRKLFSRHDLDRLSTAKPGLIERVINNGTKKVIQDMRDLSNPEHIKNLSKTKPEIPVEDLKK